MVKNSFEDVEKARDNLAGILLSDPYNEYINSVRISHIDVWHRKVDFVLEGNEDFDDYCLLANFRKEPPAGLAFPLEIDGKKQKYRVFYSHGGEIFPS